ncbi:MAG: DNA primase [Neisseriaceae bacterium]|jgi:DNA primase|nr:MAG: DNA primase [Neisseriaceae bacterium]
MQISQQSIDDVISRADIVDVISKYIKVKKSGQNFFACCPFHNEKSASFSISPSKQIFHCFGCGESGNSITFVMKYLGLDFVGAVRSLAEQYNVYLPQEQNFTPQDREEQKKKKQHKLNIHDVLKKAVNYYRRQLLTSSYATHYLENRELTKETIDKFELGFAPNGFQNLASEFSDYATNKLLIDSGLTLDSESGRRYDRFRERITYPIKNIKGEVIGFGGRIITKGEPKYLNSPETELFNKSKELYGLFEAAKSIREQNQVIVVEGYMDVIALHQHGITNAVATMGTSVTEEHIKQLFRMCDNICYSFDGDNAGKKAAWRALERSVGLVTDIKAVNFLFLPEEHDPDSFVRQFGTDAFKLRIANSSIGLVNFLLNQLVSEVQINTDEGKARLISLVKPFLEQIKALALQVILKKQLATIVDLEPNVIESILNNRTKFAFYNRKLSNINNAFISHKNKTPLNTEVFENILKALIHNPKLARTFPMPSVEVLDKLDERIGALFRLIDYFDNHYDGFADVDCKQLMIDNRFDVVNLANIYQKVKLERDNYTNLFLIGEDDYRDMLDKLVHDKKKKRPPKLN